MTLKNIMSNIAIIPARCGSKGLENKNIKKLCGKPLMVYTIESAIKSGIFDCVHVSTDSEEYAKVGRESGADIPFLRSEESSSDYSSSWDVVMEVITNYQKIGKEFDIITLLQPTSPLRDEEDIINAYNEYVKKEAKAIVSVCEVEHSPLWSNVIAKDKSMANFVRKESNIPRQKLDKFYRINGAIYMVEKSFLYNSVDIYREGCYAYVMKREKSVDIDTQLDFDYAEWLIRRNI